MNTETTTLKSIREHNAERASVVHEIRRPQPSGIACPECKAELVYPNPDTVLMSYPPEKHVACTQCEYKGTVLA